MQSSIRFISERGKNARTLTATGIVLCYFVLASISLRIVQQPAGLAALWPASGLSLAVLVCSPYRSWPLLATLLLLATTLANCLVDIPLLVSGAFAVANVLESVIAAVFLRWPWDSPLRLHTLRDLLRFVLGAVIGTNAVTALLGATIPALAFGTPLWSAWQIWWVTDGLGMLVVGGLVISWWGSRWSVRWEPVRRWETLGLVLILVVSSLLLFGTTPTINSFASPYLIFPVLMWAALRFGMPGASASVAWVSAVVLFTTSGEIGPFAVLDLPLSEQLIRAQLFLFIVSLSAFMLAVIMRERQEAQTRLFQINLILEQQVAERTAALTTANRQLQHEIAQRQVDITNQKVVEERLRESEMKLQAALDGGQLGAWYWDPETNHVVADARTLDLFGIDPAQFTEHAAMSFSRMHPEDRSSVWAALDQALQPDGQYDTEFRVVLPDGQIRWLAGAGRARRDATGRVLQVYGVNLDITERKQAEQTTHFLLELDAALTQLTDADEIEQMAVERLGSFLSVGHCFFAQVADGRSMVHQVYRPGGNASSGTYDLEPFFSPEDLVQLAQGSTLVVNDATAAPRPPAAIARCHTLSIGAFLTTPVLYQGHWVAMLIVASPSRRAWRPDEVHLLHEVTTRVWPRLEQARTQAALRASEAKLQLLYAQEHAARAQAEQAGQAKDEFLAIVSHELRTPLTAFLGYTQLLQMRPCDDPYIVRTLEKMFQSARVQAHLIEDLLDVSRIVNGKLHIERHPLDMRWVIQTALETVQPLGEDKRLHLHIDLPDEAVRLLGDPDRLQQVMWNLLANAIKFTPPGGTITTRLVREDQQLVLTVSDTGQGIGPDFLPFVFDRFRQAEGSSNRIHRGLGLGLAIVRHIVELHSGTVEVASAGEGQGSTFTVRLPLAHPAPVVPDLPAPARRGERETGSFPILAGVRVLVVDDQPDILEVVREILTAQGALVQRCTTARQALDLLATWHPQILVSDIAMPDQDGYWLIGQVRARPPEAGGATPAIAVTAYVQPEEQQRGLAAGFQDVLSKLVEPDELCAVIARLVRSGVQHAS